MAKTTTPPAWRGAFLRVLAESANVRLSAREAGIDYSTAYYHRDRDPGFAAQWAQAKAAAQAAGSAAMAAAAAQRAGPDGAARGLTVRSSHNCGLQLVRIGEGQWTDEGEARFIFSLAATANVRLSAQEAGFSTTAIYRHRMGDADFQAKWDAAVDQCRARLEAVLLDTATRTFDPESVPVPKVVPTITAAQAIALLRLPVGSARRGARSRALPPEPPIEEVRESILRKLDAIEAHDRRIAAEGAPGAGGADG